MRAPLEYNKLHIDKDDVVHRDLELGKGSAFNLEFIFDCDVRCAITIYYFSTEEYTSNGVTYVTLMLYVELVIRNVFTVTFREIQA